jgi:capsular polysaccharide biosynthesis protein
MEKYFDNSNLVQLLWRWKIHLAVIVVIAVILSAIFSSPFFITPKFKSYAVAYPSNISEYSDESTSEQMFQVLQSQDIRDSVIEKYDLPSHYEIDRDYKYFKTAINYEFSQNVKINKTPYDAISIEVMDKDPQMAADIALSMLHYYDKKVSRMHKGKYAEVIDMYRQLLKAKQVSIDSLQNRLFELSREKGLLSYEQTSSEVMRGYLKTIMGADKSNINTKEVERLKVNLEEYGGELIELTELIKQEARTYADFKVEYEDAWRFYNADLTYSNIVTYPFPADKKAYPIRWLIVVISVMVTFFLAIILIVISENYRKVIK